VFILHCWPTNLLFFSLVIVSCIATSNFTPDELLLSSLIKSIKGLPDDWMANFSNPNNTYCSWKGIKCFKDKENQTHLRLISLPNSNLTGKLPLKGWVQLRQYLSIVRFSNNFLNGPLPAELLSLKNAQIYLDNNNFGGFLPNILTNFGCTLTQLQLQSNRFTGCIPTLWGSMSSLCITDPPSCPGLNLQDNYFNCSDLDCMMNLPNLNSQSYCPVPFFICQEGQYCWHIPQTIVLMITLMCSGFIVGTLAMFFAAKYIDMGISNDHHSIKKL